MGFYELLILCVAGSATLGEVPAERAGDTKSSAEVKQVLPPLRQMKETVGGMALWRQQVCAIARVRLLNLKHDPKALFSLWVSECPMFCSVGALKKT